MANKKDGEDFDDDLDWGADDSLGDLGDEDFGDFGLDDEKDRKPAKSFFGLNAHYVNKAKDGALAGIRKSIKDTLPEADNFVDGVAGAVNDAAMMKDEFMKELRPTLNQTKLQVRRLAQQYKNFIPDSIYDKVLKKLEVGGEDDGRTPSAEEAKKEARQTAINSTLTSIFKAQIAGKAQEAREEKVNTIVSRRIEGLHHKQEMGSLVDLRVQAHFQSTFLRTTLTAWMKKDLELKLRSMYISEDILIATKHQNDILNVKLEQIKHNTALPEVDKINLTERVKKEAQDMALATISGTMSNWTAKAKEKIKKNILGPLKEGVDGLSMAAEALGMQVEFDSPMTVSKALGHAIGMGTSWATNRLANKALKKVIPKEALDLINQTIKNGGPQVKLMLDALARGKTPTMLKKFNLPDSALDAIKTLAENIAPTISKTEGNVRNAAWTDPLGAGTITNKFTATVEEVIPGYLRLQTKYLEAIAKSKAIAAPINGVEEQYYDFKNRGFETASVMTKRVNEMVYGTDDEIRNKHQNAMSSINDAGKLKAKGYNNNFISDVAFMIESLAMAKDDGISAVSLESANWLKHFIDAEGDRAEALANIPYGEQDTAKSFFEWAFDKSHLSERYKQNELVALASELHDLITDNMSGANFRAALTGQINSLLEDADQVSARADISQIHYGGLVAKHAKKNERGEAIYANKRMELSSDYIRNRADKLGMINEYTVYDDGMRMKKNENGKWEEVTAEEYNDKTNGVSKTIKNAKEKVTNIFKSSSTLAGTTAKAGARKLAKKLGKEEEFNQALEVIEGWKSDSLKFLGSTKEAVQKKLESYGIKAKNTLYRKLYNWGNESDDLFIKQLTNLFLKVTKEGKATLNSNIDNKILATLMLDPDLKFYERLKEICSADDAQSGPMLVLASVLPYRLRQVANMDPDDYADFLDDKKTKKGLTAKVAWLEKYFRKHDVGETFDLKGMTKSAEERIEASRDQYKKFQEQEKEKHRTAQEGKKAAKKAEKKTEEAKDKEADTNKEETKTSTGKAGGPETINDKIDSAAEKAKGYWKKAKKFGEEKLNAAKKALTDKDASGTSDEDNTRSPNAKDFKSKFDDVAGQVKKSVKDNYNKAKGFFNKDKGVGNLIGGFKARTFTSPGIEDLLSKQLAVQINMLSAMTGGKVQDISDMMKNLNFSFNTGNDKKEKSKSKLGKIWRGIKGLTSGYFGVLGAGMSVVGGAASAAASIVTNGLFTRVFDVYVAPTEAGSPITKAELRISAKQFVEGGVYADPTAKKRIYTPTDMKPGKPVYDADGKPLLEENDWIRGLVKANGKPITSKAAKLGRMIYKSGKFVVNTAASGIASVWRKLTLPGLNNLTSSLITAPLRGLQSATSKFFDVYRKDDKTLLITAKDQEEGRVVFENGKEVKRTTAIDAPLIWVGREPRTYAISPEDIKVGVVDYFGKPINAFIRKVANLFNIGGDAALKGIKLFSSGFVNTYSWMFKHAVKGIKTAFTKKNPYISVYIKDDMGNFDPGKPVLKGDDIKAGKYRYSDGSPVKSAYGIKGAVYEILADGSPNCIIKEDEVSHLCDFNGKSLTKFAGRSLVGKAYSFAFSGLKWGIGKAWKLAKGAAKLGKKGLDVLLGGLGRGAKEGIGFVLHGLTSTLHSIFGQDLINRKDLMEVVGERLDKIYQLLDYRLPGKPIAGDSDGDGDRDNSYQDTRDKKKAEAEATEAKRKAARDANAKKQQDAKDAKAKAAEAEALRDAVADGGSGGGFLDWLSGAADLKDIFGGKSARLKKMGKTWGKRLNGVGKLGGKAASFMTGGRVGKTLGEKGIKAAASGVGSTVKSKAAGWISKLAGSKLGTSAAAKIAGGKLAASVLGKIAGQVMSRAIPFVGTISAIGLVIGAASNVMVWTGSKIRDAIFGSKNEHEFLDIKRKGYGIKTNEYDGVIEDIEDELVEVLDGSRGPFSDDELEDFAEDFDLLSPKAVNAAEKKIEDAKKADLAKRQAYLAKKAEAASGDKPKAKIPKPKLSQDMVDKYLPDTKDERQRYFNLWFVDRMSEVFKNYYGVVRYFTHTKPGDDLDPDDIGEAQRNQAAKIFDNKIKAILSNGKVAKLVPTEEGYQQWRADYAGQIKTAREAGIVDKHDPDAKTGASSILTSEQRASNAWKSWRSAISMDWIDTAKYKWYDPRKWLGLAAKGVGWLADSLINGTLEFIADSAIGDAFGAVATAAAKGGIFTGLFRWIGGKSKSDKEQAWFDSRAKMYGWETTGKDMSYDTEDAIADLEDRQFEAMASDAGPASDDELKKFGENVGFLQKTGIFGAFNSVFGRGAESSYIAEAKAKSTRNQKFISKTDKKTGKVTKEKFVLEEQDTPEARFAYLKQWYNGRFAPVYSAYAQIVVQAAEQETGEKPDPNKIPEFKMAPALKAFEQSAKKGIVKEVADIAPTEKAYQIWLEKAYNEALRKAQADADKAAMTDEARTPEQKMDQAVASAESKSDEKSPETVKVGDKELEVNKAGVGWINPMEALSNAGAAIADAHKKAWSVLVAPHMWAAKKLGQWWSFAFGGSEKAKQFRSLRYDGYGFKSQTIEDDVASALSDLEEETNKVIQGVKASFDPEFLEDFAKDMGFKLGTFGKITSFITNFFNKDAQRAQESDARLRTEYLNNWYESRFKPVYSAYFSIMQKYGAIDEKPSVYTRMKSIDEDKIADEKLSDATRELDNAIKQITSDPDVKSLIPTEEDYQKFVQDILPKDEHSNNKVQTLDDKLKEKADRAKEKKEQEIANKKANEQNAKLDNASSNAQDKAKENKKEDSGFFSSIGEKASSMWSGIKSVFTGESESDAAANATVNNVPKAKKYTPTEAGRKIWKFFKGKGWSDEGIAALMGNLDKESGLESIRLQSDFDPQRKKSIKYAEDSDKNKSVFMKETGFGIAQWTTSDRKENLWNFAQSRKKSVGDLDTQLEFLNQELETRYKKVTKQVKTTKNLAEGARIILQQFEVARDRFKDSEIEDRGARAQGVYNEFAGKDLGPDEEVTAETSKSIPDTNLSTPNNPGASYDGGDSGGGGAATSWSAPSQPLSSSSDSSDQTAKQTSEAFNKTGVAPDSDGSTADTSAGAAGGAGAGGTADASELKKVTRVQSGVDVDNEHPLLISRFTEMSKEFKEKYGHAPTITSGKRSLADQQRLFNKYGPKRAARPNPLAPHISGLALDADPKDMTLADNSGLLAKYGLWRPLKNWAKTKEPWHVETTGSRDPNSKVITKETKAKADQLAGETTSPTDGKTTDATPEQVANPSASTEESSLTANTSSSASASSTSDTSSIADTSSTSTETISSSSSTPTVASQPTVNVANPGATNDIPAISSTPVTDPSSFGDNTGMDQLNELKTANSELAQIRELVSKLLEMQTNKQEENESNKGIKERLNKTGLVKTDEGTDKNSTAILTAFESYFGSGSIFATAMSNLASWNANSGMMSSSSQSSSPRRFNPSNPISVSRG